MYIKSALSGASVRARIIIVANEPDTCMLLSGLLVREGCYTALVCDVEELKKVLKEEAAPDGLLVDDSFPVEKLEGLVRATRSHKAWERVPLIVLASRDAEEQETACFEAGADDYIIKPVKTKALVARVKRRVINV